MEAPGYGLMAKAIAFAWWPIFNMVSFLEYLVFFWSDFLHRTTLNDLKKGFWHVFWILIFDPNWPFCKGYSLCMAANFGAFSKSCHVSNISYFLEPFFGSLALSLLSPLGNRPFWAFWFTIAFGRWPYFPFFSKIFLFLEQKRFLGADD